MQTLAWHNLLGTNRNYIDKFAVFALLAGNNNFQSSEALTCETKNNKHGNKHSHRQSVGDSNVQMTHYEIRSFIDYEIMIGCVCCMQKEGACPLAFNSNRWLFFFFSSSPICLCQIKLATSYSHLLWRPSTIISQFFLMWAYAHGHFVNILCVRYPNSNRNSPPHRIGDTVKAQNASSSVHRHGKKEKEREKKERTRYKWRKTNH